MVEGGSVVVVQWWWFSGGGSVVVVQWWWFSGGGSVNHWFSGEDILNETDESMNHHIQHCMGSGW